MPDVDNTEEFRCISLCTGYAGLELGLKRAIPNLRTVAYVEREGFACANLVAKIEAGKLDAAPIWTDVKTFPGQLFCKRVHIITAGYPCQGESTAGERLGENDSRWLWPYIERIIEAVKPIWFFGENVSGHLTLGFPTVYRSLRNLGYSVETGLFSAAECNLAHIRERIFILAHSKQQRLETYRFSRGRPTICQSQSSNKDNCIDAIERFWDTASATNRGNDGLENRLDRLRLIGNGVVPQQAELAFRTLIKRCK